MHGLGLDLLHAVRSLRRTPAYVFTVAGILGLGIGASTAMFSVLSAVLLQPLPHANGDRVVRLYQPDATSATIGLSPLEMADYRSGSQTLSAVVEYHSMPFTFIGAGEPRRLQTGVVSAGYFDVLGVEALVGRTFRPGEDQPGSDPVLLLTWDYWQSAFGGDPEVVGTTFRMNDRLHTVVGVLPRIPQYPDANDVYMPASSCPFRSGPGWAENRRARQPAFALLAPGVTIEAAVVEMQTVSRRLHAAYPDAYPADRRFTVAAVPLRRLMSDGARAPILMLLAATAFLLLIVCANVVNLAVVRLVRRDDELVTRLALGAGGRRIMRQLLMESLLLSAAGGVAALLVAWLSVGALATWLAQFSPRAHEIRLDADVYGFAAALTVLAGALGGVLPATLRLRAHGASPGRADSRSTPGARHSRTRAALLVVQVAVSLILLVAAGLMIRTLVHLQRVSPGFDPARVLTARVDLNWTRYDDGPRTAAFFREAEARLLATPGVEAAAFASSFPLNGDGAARIDVLTDREPVVTGEIRVAVSTVTPGYFATLGVPLLRGRGLEEVDARSDAPGIVITAASARRLFGGADPIGRRISSDGGQSWGHVIGVVGDVRQDLESEYEAMIFLHQHRVHQTQTRLLVPGALPAPQLERVVREVISGIDPEQPVTDTGTIEGFRDEGLAPRRIVAGLLAAFALLALTITAVGLGSVIAFSVAERAREIAIRMALGATSPRVVALVMGQAVALTIAGLVLGILAAGLLTRLLESMLFGVPPTDVLTFGASAAVLLGVAAASSAAPALRAVRIQPVRVLRG